MGCDFRFRGTKKWAEVDRDTKRCQLGEEVLKRFGTEEAAAPNFDSAQGAH